jgi:hypothetical protein
VLRDRQPVAPEPFYKKYIREQGEKREREKLRDTRRRAILMGDYSSAHSFDYQLNSKEGGKLLE